MILFIACFLLAALPAVVPAQSDPVVESRRHFRAAVEAYEAGNRAAYLQHAREAQALRPEHGGVTWALASALALTGDTAGSFRTLRHFAALGYFGDLAADSDFAGLRIWLVAVPAFLLAFGSIAAVWREGGAILRDRAATEA